MTLHEWSQRWPHYVNRFDVTHWWTIDSDSTHEWRTHAWSLSDVRVSSVSGGAIWFQAKET